MKKATEYVIKYREASSDGAGIDWQGVASGAANDSPCVWETKSRPVEVALENGIAHIDGKAYEPWAKVDGMTVPAIYAIEQIAEAMPNKDEARRYLIEHGERGTDYGTFETY